ncbi:twin-arginine translocase subunit TatC, partial [Streptomyces sp. R301]|nr:twin-arginine translocase subunit TatC [Streptomyces sp. R301]
LDSVPAARALPEQATGGTDGARAHNAGYDDIT